MAFELAEIDDADLKPGEDTELEDRISLLQNSEKIYTALESAYDISYNSEQSASYALSKAACAHSGYITVLTRAQVPR